MTLGFLVAGAGYTGERLLAALPPGETAGLRRDAAGDPRLIAADLDGDDLSIPACRTLLYLVPPSRDDDGDPRLARLLAALPAPPGRIVYFSTSGVYGDTGGRSVSEEATPAPSTARARRRVAAERRVTEYCRAHGSERCILRVPGIYGPGQLGLERLAERVAVIREAEAGPGNRIHVDDLAAAAVAAATRDTVPEVCNLGDGDHRSATAFAKTVAELAGLPAPPEVSLEEARRTFSPRRRSFLLESRRLDLARMRGELGFTPVYADASDGIRASLEAG